MVPFTLCSVDVYGLVVTLVKYRCSHMFISNLLSHMNLLNYVVIFLLTSQCIIFGVRLFINVHYRLSLAITVILTLLF
uniref:Uncharacterized protein n=1 Tax=Arundo donax TaxID=35708 RepID=A0A0A9HA49_ARUDO